MALFGNKGVVYIIKVKKTEHDMWKMRRKLSESHLLKELRCPYIGRWHYFYSSSKGEISLISIHHYFFSDRTRWEICCLVGNLLNNCKAFSSKKEAEKRIWELLE